MVGRSVADPTNSKRGVRLRHRRWFIATFYSGRCNKWVLRSWTAQSQGRQICRLDSQKPQIRSGIITGKTKTSLAPNNSSNHQTIAELQFTLDRVY